MNLTFSKTQLKIFIATLLVTFIAVSMQLFGIKPPKLVAPLPQKSDVFYDVVAPKLDQIQNTYNVHKPVQLIAPAHATGDFEDATAYAVVDFDSGEMVLSKNKDTQLKVASLTKIMTSVVALDLAKPDERFTVSQEASDMIPTKIAVTPGEQLTLEELLKASMMTSANDAVEVIRQGINTKYGEKIFVRSMNQKAMLLGLDATSFGNPQGFDAIDNYSTVRDLAVLSHYALTNYPLIADISKRDEEVLPENEYHKSFELLNWNGLIGVYPGVSGIKIGNTRGAGRTTIVLAEREGKRLLAVVLGAPGILERDLWAADLLDEAFAKTANLEPIGITEAELRAKYRSWYD